MTNEQRNSLLFGLEWATTHIQAIDAGADDLYKKADRMDVQLLLLLKNVIQALPQDLRQQAQACINVRERVSDAILARIDEHLAQWETQKEASPSCLQASDSL
jgi:hypothetical protein